jgi:hypothetical protein
LVLAAVRARATGEVSCALKLENLRASALAEREDWQQHILADDTH